MDVRGCEVASRTDVGSVRPQNQDACAALERADGARLLVVADGMGGHRGGETASRLAVEAMSIAFEAVHRDAGSPFSAEWLAEAICAANREVYRAADNDPSLRGMGTTVVSVLIDADGRSFVGHVGDSRAYRLRDGNFERLTEDHSVVAEMQRRGMLTASEAERHPRRNEILRSVGVESDVEPETREIDLQPGDSLLLCSDGLCGVLGDSELSVVMRETLARSPEDGDGGADRGSEVDRIVDAWIARANAAGGPDNITAQLLRVPSQTIPAERMHEPGELRDTGSLTAIAMLTAGVAGLVAFAWILWN